jgi:hypothetical protein
METSNESSESQRSMIRLSLFGFSITGVTWVGRDEEEEEVCRDIPSHCALVFVEKAGGPCVVCLVRAY